MKPAGFTYHDPRSCDDLIGLVGSLDNAKLLAGGQSLMPMLNLRLLAPDHVIDLNRIPELTFIGASDRAIEIGAIEIGAMTRQAELQASADLVEVVPVLREALAHVGHFQTRSRGTIGGSCCHLDPAAELPAICALMDAEFDVLGPGGGRTVAARDWFCGYLQSALEEREILKSIRWRPWPPGHGYGFCEFARRRGDFAVAGAGALVALDADGAVRRAAIVVFGVEPSPVRLAAIEAALVGRTLGDEAIAAAEEAARALDAMADAQVSASYRRHLAGVVVRRALAQAVHTAKVSA